MKNLSIFINYTGPEISGGLIELLRKSDSLPSYRIKTIMEQLMFYRWGLDIKVKYRLNIEVVEIFDYINYRVDINHLDDLVHLLKLIDDQLFMLEKVDSFISSIKKGGVLL